jgi:hypothetical protein
LEAASIGADIAALYGDEPTIPANPSFLHDGVAFKTVASRGHLAAATASFPEIGNIRA